jgi:hypothetical protein
MLYLEFFFHVYGLMVTIFSLPSNRIDEWSSFVLDLGCQVSGHGNRLVLVVSINPLLVELLTGMVNLEPLSVSNWSIPHFPFYHLWFPLKGDHLYVVGL